MRDLKRVNYQPNPGLKPMKWLDRRLVLRGYSYPVKNLLLIAIVFLLIISLAVYFLIAHQSDNANPDVALQKETKALTDRIGKFMDLPVDEQPTLATVTDQEKLKGQDFFTHAQNGDKLLVYSKARKAILYRPSTKKVIEVSNLISGEDNQGQPPADTNQAPEN
ncbi:MAG: hypothetical protein NT093_03655 [Candidatus Moranbacteria bacterium]|nr:hypothetical protein [Candidatus Moranbacteria bacterium]